MQKANVDIDAPAPPPAWTAVDPARAGAMVPADPTAAPVPGVTHAVQAGNEKASLGGKWSSSNAKSPGQTSTQGVVDEVNHNLGGARDYGTDAEVGLKFHF